MYSNSLLCRLIFLSKKANICNRNFEDFGKLAQISGVKLNKSKCKIAGLVAGLGDKSGFLWRAMRQFK